MQSPTRPALDHQLARGRPAHGGPGRCGGRPRDQQKPERARLLLGQPRFPVFKDWLAGKNPDLAQQWRYRERRAATLEGATSQEPVPRDIRAFDVVDGGIVHYRLAGKK